MRRKLRKVIRWLLLFVGAACAAMILGTVVPRPLLDQAASSEAPTRRILVLASPIHTDIAVPIDCDHAAANSRSCATPACRSTIRTPAGCCSAGAAGPITWRRRNLSDTTVGPLFKALTLDASVMHVEILGTIDETHAAVSGFDGFGGRTLDRMLAFIRASFAETDGAPVHVEGAHYGDADGFFEANGSFNALIGCNTWTARALRQAGLQTGWWNPLPETLAFSLALHN